jgi:hypothetical protein
LPNTPLNPSTLDAFFAALAARVPCRVKLILTGGAEALLLGSTRPTQDLDFGVVPTAPPQIDEQQWAKVEAAIAEASRITEIAVEYSGDIDRWSSIAMPDYQRHTRPYKRFGRVSVHLLEPAYWAVPKLARYLDTDSTDLEAVLRAQGVKPQQLARVCSQAFRASPRSTALFPFRQHVEHFFRAYGTGIWGEDFDAEAAIRAFRRGAGIRGGGE